MNKSLVLEARYARGEKMKLPESLYHGTYFEEMQGILQQGLQPGIDGEVYLTSSAGEAVFFGSNRRFHGLDRRKQTEYFATGRHDEAVQMEQDHDRGEVVWVIEIDPKKLDPDKLDEGTDHNSEFFQGQVVIHAGPISTQAITGVWEIDAREEIEEQDRIEPTFYTRHNALSEFCDVEEDEEE